MRERPREQLHVGGRDGVVAGKEPAAEQPQRKALIAVAVEVPDGQQIDLAHVLIDLADQAVHPVAEQRRRLQVVAVLVGVLIRCGQGC
jgi:hypothetical protein